jgi:hypothetical protein
MTFKTNQRAISRTNKILFIAFFVFISLCLSAPGTRAQTPSPSPSPSSSNDETTTIGGYEITSSVELGVRGLNVNGNHEKYRSDFNYKNGFRVFDSSFLMEHKDGKHEGLFDSLLIATSGWNADPTGSVRVNIEKMGAYRFDSNVRQVHYYNQLFNHAYGWKGANTKRNFGDFDLTVLPQNEDFRMRFGASFYRTTGTAGFTTRPFSDEFPVTRVVDLGSTDLRFGVDGKLAGFKLSLTARQRRFDDETDFRLFAPHPGANTTNTSILTGFERIYPINGRTKYGTFSAQRTFAKRLDFTGRFIYSLTDRKFRLDETVVGRDASNNIINPDVYFFFGGAKRTQSRGDIGLTYAVTNKFRISNTFSFEQYDVTGDSRLNQVTTSRTATGGPRPTTFVNTLYYRLDGFKRFLNTIEGDYQFSPRFGVNIGYRFTHRQVDLAGFNRPLAPSTALPTIIVEEEENSTNTLLVGTRIKPFKNWSIFADLEHGESDNAFTRLSNYNFTNFRVRSNWNYRQFSFNVSAIARNNENPSQTSAITNAAGTVLVPAGELIGNVKNRVFSAYVDWTPDQRFSISTGYTYHHLTSETDIVVPLATLTRGFSQFFIRDSYAFFDITAQPINRVSVFASYRFNKDAGQGDRVSNQANIIVSSYPFRLNMPEIRVAVRLTRNIDWNVGYQYYDYRENLQRAYFDPIPPNQNYNAHMPYTSLRFYFGGGDRGR